MQRLAIAKAVNIKKDAPQTVTQDVGASHWRQLADQQDSLHALLLHQLRNSGALTINAFKEV
jgi:hypothetical protein